MLSKYFYCKKAVCFLKMSTVFTVISICFLTQYIDFSYAGDITQNIHIRGIATNNKDVPLVIIEDPSSGNIKAYRLHDKLNDFEIVDIKKREGILLKKGEKKIWVLLSSRDSSWNKGKSGYEEKRERFYKIQKEQLDINNIITKSVTDTEKKDNEPAGVTVTELKRGSFLAVMGVEPGDTLLQFNQHNINQPEDLEDAIEKFINTEFNDQANNNIRIVFRQDGKDDIRYGKVH